METFKKIFLGLSLLSILHSYDICTMDAPGESSKDDTKKLVYTKHVKEKMEQRKITEEDIQAIIETGQRFLDTKNPDSILYRDKSKKAAKQLVVVTKQGSKPNQLLIITVYYAENLGSLPKKKNR